MPRKSITGEEGKLPVGISKKLDDQREKLVDQRGVLIDELSKCKNNIEREKFFNLIERINCLLDL